MRADGGRFSDDDAGAVVDEEMRADARAGMDVHARALMGEFRDHPRQERDAEVVEHVGEALERDAEDAWISQDDLLIVARGWVSLVSRLHVRPNGLPQIGEPSERFPGQGAGVRGGVGIAREPQAFLDFDLEPLPDVFQQRIDQVWNVLFRKSPLLEIARSEEHTSEPSHLVISYAVFCLKKSNLQVGPAGTRPRCDPPCFTSSLSCPAVTLPPLSGTL